MVKRSLWFLVFSLMAVSCLDQPDCFSLNNNIVGISFKRLSNNRADTIGITRIIADGAGVEFVPNDAVQTSVNLPLNLYTNSTTFVVEAGGQMYDLKLDYTSKAQFVSEDCGAKYVITGLRAASQTFDSVRVASSTPKSQDGPGTNIEVFRCPNTSRIKIRFISQVTISKIETGYSDPITGSATPVSTILVPLNTTESQSSVKFTFADGTTKDLVLNYDREFDTLFGACGEQVIISELTVTSHTFTAATVRRKAIQDPNQTNIEITF